MENVRILVVEDENIIAEEIRVRLENLGYTISDIVSSGEEAIEKVAVLHPDLILMDIQLPDISGYDVTKKIKQINVKIPIVAQTAYASESDKIKCLQAGCDDYITKPIDENILFSIINKLLK